MGGSVIWLNITRVGGTYFHKPQASENTAHECNIQAILHDQPLNDVFILYLVNIIIILMNNDCLT